jgi:hypothetical protein
MARKEKKPDREAGALEVGLFLLLAGLLFGLMVWRHLHLPDEERPKPLSWETGRALPSASLALLWPSGQLHRSAPSDIKKVPDRSPPEISHGPLSSLP